MAAGGVSASTRLPRWARTGADAGDPHKPGRHPLIEIRRSLSEPNLLDTVIHEVLHAARPELDETAVDQTATSIARALYQMGWRRKLD
jgi:hypothetical protein